MINIIIQRTTRMFANNASENKSDNVSDDTADHNHKKFDIENLIKDIVTALSQNKEITDTMAKNIGDHITEYVCDHIKDIINDIIIKIRRKNQRTIEEINLIITICLLDFITKYITDSDINELTKPIINWKPLKKIVFIDEEIKRLDRKIAIETIRHPTKKNPNRRTYVIKSQLLCNHLDIKGRKIENINKQKLLQLKYESIADI